MAKIAAARGMLPLAPDEQLAALRLLSADEDEEVRETAGTTLRTYDAARLRPIVENPQTSQSTLAFLASWKWLPRDIYQPLIFHPQISGDALVHIAATSELGDVIELVSLRQQSLIQFPGIIEAILSNPRRTPEAERRAREVREEFFEKAYGVQVVADEQRVQAEAVAEDAIVEPVEPTLFIDDLSQFIEADLVATGDELYYQFIEQNDIDEASFPLESEPAFDLDEFLASEEFTNILDKEKLEIDERISVMVRIATMTVKDRVRFALRGTREIRMILVRDPNRIVCSAVLSNPRITEHEVETISSLRSVHEEVLRVIGSNRAWTRSYTLIHNLVRNPKTPVALSLNFLQRIQSRDLRVLGTNKNIPEVVRSTASRTYLKRQHG